MRKIRNIVSLLTTLPIIFFLLKYNHVDIPFLNSQLAEKEYQLMCAKIHIKDLEVKIKSLEYYLGEIVNVSKPKTRNTVAVKKIKNKSVSRPQERHIDSIKPLPLIPIFKYVRKDTISPKIMVKPYSIL